MLMTDLWRCRITVLHLIPGDHVPVDMTPRPCACAHATTMNCNCGPPQFAGDPGCCTPTGMSTTCSRKAHHVQCPKSRDIWDHNEFSASATVGSQLRPPEPAPEKPARPEQQGHRPPDRSTATAESLWSSTNWTMGKTSAAQQGYRRPSTNCNYATTTVFAPSNGHVRNLVQELHELQNSALSGPRHRHGHAQGNTNCPQARGKHKPTTELKNTKEAFLVLHEESCVSHWAVGTKTTRAIDFKPESRVHCLDHTTSDVRVRVTLLWGTQHGQHLPHPCHLTKSAVGELTQREELCHQRWDRALNTTAPRRKTRLQRVSCTPPQALAKENQLARVKKNSTIGAGAGNTAGAGKKYSVTGAGASDTAGAGEKYSITGSGGEITAGAGAKYSTTGTDEGNTAGADAKYSTTGADESAGKPCPGRRP